MTQALLVIDVQESFMVRESWAEMHNPQIADQVAQLVAAMRAAGEPVFWVLHSEPDTGNAFDPAQGHVRLQPGLVPRPDEPVIIKTSANAFTTTNLLQQLLQRGVREVVICGIRTDQCCETTARVASDLGLGVTFVTDATTTTGIGALSAADVVERTEMVLREREFATIATTEEIVTARRVGAMTG